MKIYCCGNFTSFYLAVSLLSVVSLLIIFISSTTFSNYFLFVDFLSVTSSAMAQYLVLDSFPTDMLRINEAESKYYEILAGAAGGVRIICLVVSF